MYDAVVPANIPPGGDAVAGYVGGRWPTFTDGSLFAVAGGRRLLSIAVEADLDAEALDIEQSDATDNQVAGWLARALARKVWRPVLYTSADNAGTVVGLVQRGGIGRGEFRLWSAHYGAGEHICTSRTCAPSSPVAWEADGTQWLNTPRYDQSMLKPKFFPPLPTAGTVNTAAPAARASKEDDMPWLVRTEGEPGVYLVEGGSRSHVDAASLEALVKRFGPVEVLDAATVGGIPVAKP